MSSGHVYPRMMAAKKMIDIVINPSDSNRIIVNYTIQPIIFFKSKISKGIGIVYSVMPFY